VSTPLSLSVGLVDVSGRKPRPGVDRRDGGGVLDVVTLLGASRLETRRGGSRLPSSGVRRCLGLIFRGAMHAIAGVSKTVTTRSRPSSAIFSF
jgi:hypothetical protein